MPPALIIVVISPLAILALVVWLRNSYGDDLFGLDWPGHDLNDPSDPQILKLKLDDPQHPPGNVK